MPVDITTDEPDFEDSTSAVVLEVVYEEPYVEELGDQGSPEYMELEERVEDMVGITYRSLFTSIFSTWSTVHGANVQQDQHSSLNMTKHY